jgi:biopolymer transport protein ExbD
MKFRAQQRSPMPDMNLVPLMDVIMVILTFFIILSMTLTNFRSIDIRLPQGEGNDSAQSSQQDLPLIVGLNNRGQVLLQGKAIAQKQLEANVSTYLDQNPTGIVVLQIDEKVPYQKVSQILGTLRTLGGDRVSLAIE